MSPSSEIIRAAPTAFWVLLPQFRWAEKKPNRFFFYPLKMLQDKQSKSVQAKIPSLLLRAWPKAAQKAPVSSSFARSSSVRKFERASTRVEQQSSRVSALWEKKYEHGSVGGASSGSRPQHGPQTQRRPFASGAQLSNVVSFTGVEIGKGVGKAKGRKCERSGRIKDIFHQ